MTGPDPEVLNVTIRRLFAAGLELHKALAKLKDRRVRLLVCDALDEMDSAIRHIQRAAFETGLVAGSTIDEEVGDCDEDAKEVRSGPPQ